MGWSGSITSSSAFGTSITFTPSTTTEGAYTVSTFTAPVKGIYRFQLYGSGGTKWGSGNADLIRNDCGGADGGAGGYTDGYLLLEQGQTVYVGAGGKCSAAFVSKITGSKLSAITKENLYFVAGGGGAGSSWYDSVNKSGWNCKATAGSAGGGAQGATMTGDYSDYTGKPGTQTAGGAAASVPGEGVASKAGSYGTGGAPGGGTGSKYGAYAGRGGDGLYGGGGGHAQVEDNAGRAGGGGGGSGYVATANLTVGSTTYTSTTSQGGGAAPDTTGRVVVTYHAPETAEMPIVYNGTKIEKLIFNGTEVTSVIYNGTKLF